MLDEKGHVVETAKISTTTSSIERYFKGRARARGVLELGTHSPWWSRKLDELGLEVIVANARSVKLMSANDRKDDQVDAELLARLGRVDPQLLAPAQHRAEDIQADLAMIRARNALVASRTALINTVRGLVKSRGGRIRSCSADSFFTKAFADVPTALRPAVLPLLELIGKHTVDIRAYDANLKKLCETKYPETGALMEIDGVGVITALCLVLTLEDDVCPLPHPNP